MRIVTIAEYVPAYLGSDLRINQISNSLAARHSVHFAVMEPMRHLSKNGDLGLQVYMQKRARNASTKTIDYLNLPRSLSRMWNYSYLLAYVTMSLWLTLSTLRLLHRKRPDVILLAHPSPNCGLIGLVCSKILGKPVVLDYPDNWTDLISSTLGEKRVGNLRLNFLKRIEGLVVKESDSIITCSKAIEESAIKQGASPRKIHLIPSGVDFTELPLEQGSNHAKQEESFHVVYSGRLESWSNVQSLIYALNEVVKVRTDVMLTIIGDGTDRQELEKLVGALNLRQYVRFLGTLPRGTALTQVALADVVVSTFNGAAVSKAALPVKLLEYMALGKPVVATNSETVRTIIDNGLNGVLYEAEDYKQLAKAILGLISNPEKRQQMGMLAKKTVIKGFDLKEKSLQYEALLLELV